MHGENQPRQSQVMIAVQVADKNVTNFMDGYGVVYELQLGTFTTINQKVMVLNVKKLRRGESAVSRQCSTGAKDGEF